MQHITVTDRQMCLFKTDSTDSPDCLPVVLSISVCTFLVFLFLQFLVVGSFSAHAFSLLMLLEGHLACICLVLPFWYRLTRVVPEKRPLNGCVCV